MARKMTIDTGLIKLHSGEVPLWSHLHAAPAPGWSLSPETDKKLSVVNKFISLAILLCVAFYLWNNRAAMTDKNLDTYLILVAFFGLGLIIGRFIKRKPLHDQAQKETYRNAVITDQRMILYNHDEREPITIEGNDISKAALDYHEGGLALKILRRSAPEPAFLVGTAEFKEALAILNQKLITR